MAWRHSRVTRRSLVQALAVGALAMAPASGLAEVRLTLPTASVPGLHAAGASRSAARSDLAGGMRGRLRRLAAGALYDTSSARGRALTLRSDAFVFASSASAARVESAWRRLHHARRAVFGYVSSGRRAVTVSWRDGGRVGVIVLSATRRVRDLRRVAVRDAALADGWLRSVLPATAWGRVLARIRPDGSVSKATALQAFVLAYGSLPGVSAPPGRRAGIPSGTLASQWIIRYLPRLSRRQRAVVERRLGLPRSRRVARVADLDDPTFHQDVEIQALADDFIGPYQALTGHTLKVKVIGGLTSEVVKTQNGGFAYADTFPFNAQGDWDTGQLATCRIRITPLGQSQSLEFLKLVVAHELFHCFQFDMVGGWNLPAAWITEGMADWAALSVDPVSWKVGGGNLHTYLFSPQTPLFERSYDAVGFWGHAEDEFPGLFKRAASILNASSNYFAYDLAVGSDTLFLGSWGSSPFRAASAGGPAWQMHSPIEPPAFGSLPLAYQTINPSILGGDGVVDAPPLTTAQYIVNVNGDEPVLHVVIAGYARLGLKEDYTDLKDAWFCVGGASCECPKGTTGTVPATQQVPNGAALGLSGGPGVSGTYGDLTSYPLSHFCQPKHPQPSPGHGGAGNSNGDPYITTFDGAGYGFQTAGEFTLVKSMTDNLEIQARQVPYPSTLFPSLARSLAMNTAFAMRVGGATVEIDKGMPLVLYINHHRRRPSRGHTIRLAGGGRITYGPRQAIVTWRDGTRARVLSIGDEGVNIAVTPSGARAGLLRGLFGSDDGHVDDDFIGRDGRHYNAQRIENVGLIVRNRADIHLLLSGFGRSWRITHRQSLFVYPRGKSTRSYVVRGFPRVPVSLASLPSRRRRAGAGACRHAGVTNPTLLVGCEIDYGATGDRRLATAAGTLQHAAGLSGPSRPPSSGAITKSPVGWTQLSSELATSYGPPSVAISGGEVVTVSRRSSDQAIEATTFTATAKGVSGVSRTLPFTGWLSTLNPVLLPAPGGGLQAIIAGQHSGDSNDLLNGTLLVPRQGDGSFGTPTPLDAMLSYGATSATLAADGRTPLWASGGSFGDQLLVFSGSVAHDLTADSPGFPSSPVIGRDNSGRVWLAWSVFTSAGGEGGLYMMQLGPQTGLPLGPPVHAPSSDDRPVGDMSIAMPCAQQCRLLYSGIGTAGAADGIYSWAPGEHTATPVASGLFGGHQHGIDAVAGAYTASGRLWITWADPSSGIDYAKLGGSTGAGGDLIELPQPPKLFKSGFNQPAHSTATTIGERLVPVTLWNDGQTSASSSVWATVVNAH